MWPKCFPVGSIHDKMYMTLLPAYINNCLYHSILTLCCLGISLTAIMPPFTVLSNSFLGIKGNGMLINCNVCTSNMFWFYPLFLEGMEIIPHPLPWWLKELIAINWWLSDWVLNVPLSKHAICILECIKSIPSKYWVKDAPSEMNKLWYHLKWQRGQNQRVLPWKRLKCSIFEESLGLLMLCLLEAGSRSVPPLGPHLLKFSQFSGRILQKAGSTHDGLVVF